MSDYLRAQASRAAIPANQRAVLVALCDACGEDDGTKCYASQAYLAYKSRYSVRQLRRILATLEKSKYIASAVIDYTGWGHNLSYRIFIDRVPMMPAWSEVKRELRKRGELDNDTRDDLTVSPDILSAVSPDILSAVSPDILSAVSPDILSADSKSNPIRTLSYKNSLARSAATTPVTSPTTAAPPERRTRERDFDDSALRRDPLTLALIACLGHEPANRREWGQWRIALNNLHECGATPDDIPRAIRGYQATYPKARVTPLALAGHWSEIQEGKPHDIAQLEISRRTSAATAAKKAERERADAERREQEQREVQRLLREYDYADSR